MQYTPCIYRLKQRPPFQLNWRCGVLLRSTNWLGDALMTLPAAWQLRRCVPEACGFFVLCPQFLAPLWRACPWVDYVIPMAEKRIAWSEACQVRRCFPGVAVIFPNSFGAAWDVYRCRVRQRVGRVGRFRSLLLTHRIPEWPRVSAGTTAEFHQLTYYLDLVSSCGNIEWSSRCPALSVDKGLAEKLGMTGRGWLVLAPGAAYGPAKQWPVESFLTVAKAYVAKGGRIALVGTAHEKEATAFVASHIPHALDLAGRTSLDELMAVLSCADAVVANDSGAMHLAAAVGTPGVAIFGSTDPIATGPLGAEWRLLVAETSCRPCFQRTCVNQEKSYACLRSITSVQVLAELSQLGSSG